MKMLPALVLVWSDDSGKEYWVGDLAYQDGLWSLRFGYQLSEARRAGFRRLSGIPEELLDEPEGHLESPSLFPSIRRRIPDLRRTDVLEILKGKATLPEQEQFYWYLRLTKGRLLGDAFKFVVAGTLSAEVGAANPALRNDLRRIVKASREALEADARLQLESRHGIRPDGVAIPIGDLPALAADEVRQVERDEVLSAIAHHEVRGLSRPEAYARFVRETAFTYLNRIAAMKLMEHSSRALVRESVGSGRESKGFREFCRVAPGAVRSQEDGGYRMYLDCLFDEVATEVGVLFDRTGPHSILFPTPQTIDTVLGLLNTAEIAEVWADDETLGWIYQYFTPKEERDLTHEKRRRSGPANSYELAFLNQFYTPRYVVEFLVRNTLGRLWEEMKAGKRERRDPRTIRVLDPACGSGHFLLGAFDRLLVIYEEAYGDPGFGVDLRRDFPNSEAFRREVPRLIVSENLFGVDIDLRAVQVASLAIYLRAQRAYQARGFKAPDRPAIERMNVAVADAMPGESDLFEGFLDEEVKVPFLKDLARAIWKRLQGAGEIGSLLKIREELGDEIQKAREAFQLLAKGGQLLLFPNLKPGQLELPFEGITEESFFDTADRVLFQALDRYAKRFGPDAFRRRIFGHDAEEGVKFLDVIRRPYDVVLMNPPFGIASKGSKEYIDDMYKRSSNDLFAAFVERGLELLRPGGLLGAITSRTGFFLGSFQQWREEVLIKENRFRTMADLGSGVLDAMVEVAAYVVERGAGDARAAHFLRLLTADDKASAIAQVEANPDDKRRFSENPETFGTLEKSPFAYWVPGMLQKRLQTGEHFQPAVAEVRVGLQTSGDEIFIRAIWEVQPNDLIFDAELAKSLAKRAPVVTPQGRSKWAFHVKSGTSQPWYSPLGVVVDWERSGFAIKEFIRKSGSAPSRYVRSEDFYFRPGFSWTRRAVRFIPYVVPANAIPTVSRYQAFPKPGFELLAMGFTSSNVASAYMRLYGEKFEWPNFLVETLKSLPWPTAAESLSTDIDQLITTEVARRRAAYSFFEPYQEFVAPLALDDQNKPADQLKYDPRSLLGRDLEVKVAKTYGFAEADLDILQRDLMEALEVRRRPSSEDDGEGNVEEPDDAEETVIQDTLQVRAELLVSYAIGVLFGRWDVRIGKDRTLAPKPAGPFDPLPFYPPGGLVGPDGFPAKPDTIVSEDWLRARSDALHLPTKGALTRPTIERKVYPIEIAWQGILPDDPDDERDIVRGIEKVLAYLYGERFGDVEREIRRALGVKDLRTYLRNPRGFFASHIQRYSALQGKHKAPIYWLLQSSNRSYGIWIYYPRISKDTMYIALREFVEPRRRRAEEAHRAAKSKGEEKQSKREARAEDLAEIVDEVAALQRAIEADVQAWDPDLDDGVLLNAAPLAAIIPWPHAKKALEDLRTGKYEWSRIAVRLKGGGR